MYDFSFLAPCPSSGLIINGSADQVAPMADVQKLVDRLKTQKGITIEHSTIEGANHFFDAHLEPLAKISGAYLDKRMAAQQQRA
jgi:alpha/beta superfamily hydrolase